MASEALVISSRSKTAPPIEILEAVLSAANPLVAYPRVASGAGPSDRQGSRHGVAAAAAAAAWLWRRAAWRWQPHTSRARVGAALMAMAVRGAPVCGCGVVRVRVLSWTWRDPRLVYRGTSCGRARCKSS